MDTSQSTSFTINSSYDNINQISKFKYYQNSELREKTKNFILEQIKDEKVNDVSNKNINGNNNLIKFNSINKLNPRRVIRKKSADFQNMGIISNKLGNLNPIKRASLKKRFTKFDSHINISNSIKKMDEDDNSRNNKRFFSVSNKNNSIKKRNSIKKPTKNKDLLNESDKTFFSKISKIRTMKRRNANTPISGEKTPKETINKKVNYERLISKNIEKNQQNLNNPEAYFEGFFNDIIFKRNKNNNIWGDGGIIKRNTFQK